MWPAREQFEGEWSLQRALATGLNDYLRHHRCRRRNFRADHGPSSGQTLTLRRRRIEQRSDVSAGDNQHVARTASSMKWVSQQHPRRLRSSTLLSDLGIANERVDANSVAATRYIVRGGRLVPLPGSPERSSGPERSRWRKTPAAREPFIARTKTRRRRIHCHVRAPALGTSS
jgi:hypothetical protein